VTLVVDTSVLVDHLRGDPRAHRLLDDAAQDGCALASSVIVRTEVLAGMRPGEERGTLLLLDALTWHDVTLEVADRAGHLARRYRRSHPGVDLADYLIAATTEHLGARLVTMNIKHFPMFPGLVRPYA